MRLVNSSSHQALSIVSPEKGDGEIPHKKAIKMISLNHDQDDYLVMPVCKATTYKWLKCFFMTIINMIK